MASSDFIDEARISVKAGNGGRGCRSFRREKFVPRGGPDGGNGGNGGSVYFEGDRGMSTLYDARHRKHHKAQRGVHGMGAQKNGKRGEDLVLRLPLGTIVRDEETGDLVGEVLAHEERFCAARGGLGGRGNACFATSTNQAPTFFEPGTPGEERLLRLELKVLADVGLLGFPNAGKSTLISRVSAAKPKVASYPFTTLQPHLGMVESGDARFVIADIPGLIPGAHEGAGLGHRFLRHVERTRMLLHLLDPEPMLREEPGRSLEGDYRALRDELERYSPDLGRRRELVRVTKADLVPDVEQRDEIIRTLSKSGISASWISSATGLGIDALTAELLHGLSELTTGELDP